jgi:GAF domain-containing protein
MSSERLLEVFDLMARSGTQPGLLCGVTTEIVAVSAASITLHADAMPMSCFCASSAVARSLVDLEIVVNEGPCTQAGATDSLVSVADLRSTRLSNWILFGPAALDLGVRSVMGVPIRIGAIRLGVLGLYNVEPGEFSEEQSTDALLMASVVARGIVALQAGAPPDTLSQELQSESAFDFSVHQAAGMLAVQGSMSIANALIALRMHAFGVSESLSSVATRVIARDLRFDPQSDEWISTDE